MAWLEVLGWTGSALLVYSLLQSRLLRLRLFNLVASVLLVGYNAVLRVWPMVAVNAVLAVINLWHLGRLQRTRHDPSSYAVVEIGPTEHYLQYVLRRHEPDIRRYNPALTWDGSRPGCLAFLVLRDDETVGVVLGRDAGHGTVQLELDYVVPRFRDFTPGEFVYRRSGLFAERGFTRVVAPPHMLDSSEYLERLGFRRPAPGAPYELDLTTDHSGR